MKGSTNLLGLAALLPTAALSLGVGFAPIAAQAADHRPFVQKHPIITGAAAAMAVHHYRHSRRTRVHHRNFVQRHPIITGAAAAVAVHHYRHTHRTH